MRKVGGRFSCLHTPPKIIMDSSGLRACLAKVKVDNLYGKPISGSLEATLTLTKQALSIAQVK
jgi:hypothetical protein